MKETKKVYALNSKRIVLTMKSPLSKAEEIKNGGGSLRYKSVIHYKRKFKIKNVIVGAKFYSTWVNISPRKARFRKQQKTLRNKEKGGYRANDNG